MKNKKTISVGNVAMSALFYLRNNKVLSFLTALYVFAMLSIISWGLPNEAHPYTYHMDEWHQLMGVRSLIKYGTPNIEGAAHGTIFYFVLSGLYLAPIALFGFSETALHVNFPMQGFIFEMLRINTLLFSIGSIIVFLVILKRHFHIHNSLYLLFFILTPINMMLSNYFKYDIALLFWILLSVYVILRMIEAETKKNFIIAGVMVGLAVATKISAIPLIPAYIIGVLLAKKRQIKPALLGFCALCLIVLLGISDVLLGKGQYGDFFTSNLHTSPEESANFLLNMHYFWYLLWYQFPLLFGHAWFVIFLFSLIYFTMTAIIVSNSTNNKFFVYKQLWCLITFFLFAVSLYPLKLYATGNRSLVLLPFLALFASYAIHKLLSSVFGKKKYVLLGFLLFMFFVQLVENIAWFHLKLFVDPRQQASNWLLQNIPKTITIGIENIPIYQKLPDIVLKEFYEDDVKKNRYSYKVIDVNSKNIPPFVIVTDYDIALFYQKRSEKESLIEKLAKLQYKKIQEFRPNTKLLLYFNSWLDIFISGIVPSPSIAIYRKS